jgi:hypothetical protein
MGFTFTVEVLPAFYGVRFRASNEGKEKKGTLHDLTQTPTSIVPSWILLSLSCSCNQEVLYSRHSTLTETHQEREHLQDAVVIERYHSPNRDCHLVGSHNISIHKSNSYTFHVNVNVNININTYYYYNPTHPNHDNGTKESRLFGRPSSQV